MCAACCDFSRRPRIPSRFPFPQLVQFYVFRRITRFLHLFDVIVPHILRECFFAFCIHRTQMPGQVVLLDIATAFALPVAGGIVQPLILRANHAVVIYVIHIFPPLVPALHIYHQYAKKPSFLLDFSTGCMSFFSSDLQVRAYFFAQTVISLCLCVPSRLT